MERIKRKGPPKWVPVGLLLVLLLGGAAGAFARWPLWCVFQLTNARLALRGIHGRSLVVDGVDVRYLEGGSGVPVVFVHGLGGQAQNWAQLLPVAVAAGYHVFALDLPGFGDSGKPLSRTYSIREQAAFVEAFMGAVHLQRAALVGESMGGWVAATVALNRPGSVERLVLMDSAGFRFELGFQPELFTPTSPGQVDGLVALLMPHPQAIPTFLKEDVVRRVASNGWVTRRALASMRTGEDLLEPRFASLTMPVLLVWGRQDAMVPLSVGEAMHRAAPKSVLVVYDGCGHIAAALCAARIAPVLTAFLGGRGPPEGSTLAFPME